MNYILGSIVMAKDVTEIAAAMAAVTEGELDPCFILNRAKEVE